LRVSLLFEVVGRRKKAMEGKNGRKVVENLSLIVPGGSAGGFPTVSAGSLTQILSPEPLWRTPAEKYK
jgi:hypothetical protein